MLPRRRTGFSTTPPFPEPRFPVPARESLEAEDRLLRGAYNATLIVLRTAYSFYAPWARLRGGSEAELRERLGRFEPLSGHPVWIQAASVGEAGIAATVASGLLREETALPVLVTTTTRTGRAAAERALPAGVARRYFPLDFPSSVRRALDAVVPRALILVETELWPNLLMEASARGIPVMVVNGRLSDRAFRRYRLARSLFSRALSRLSCVCVQTPLDAERYASLGVPRDRIRVTGNI